MTYGFSLMVFVALAGLFACSKSAMKQPIPAELTGKWSYTAYYYSTGGPGSWHPAEQSNQYIEFKADGSFTSNLAPLSEATGFKLVDSNRIQFTKPVSTDTSLLYLYKIDTLERSLTLSPGRVLCYEGCAQKFSR